MAKGIDRIIAQALTVFAPLLFLFCAVAIIYSLLNAAKRPIISVLIPVVCALLLTGFFKYTPILVEDLINSASLPILPQYIHHAESYSDTFDVADLHCDALLWPSRDLLTTQKHPFYTSRPVGMVDIPRLVKGRVKIQVFAAVNSVPRKLNFEKNARPTVLSDVLVLKTILERWPYQTWLSAKERVLYQFERLHSIAANSAGQLKIVRSGNDLDDTSSEFKVHAIMAVEGLSCLENDIDNVDKFFDAGIRILGPTHFFDTEVGGSLSGECLCGLTEFGRKVISRMKSLGMIIDLAHASVAMMSDILNLDESERPALMISHTGLSGVCESQRNLADDTVKRIAEAGGLIGITLFEPALCGGDIVGSFVKSVRHASQLVGGVDSIALGSDWDGKIHTSISAADTHILAASLHSVGNFSKEEVRKIMYENAYRFFRSSLAR